MGAGASCADPSLLVHAEDEFKRIDTDKKGRVGVSQALQFNPPRKLESVFVLHRHDHVLLAALWRLDRSKAGTFTMSQFLQYLHYCSWWAKQCEEQSGEMSMAALLTLALHRDLTNETKGQMMTEYFVKWVCRMVIETPQSDSHTMGEASITTLHKILALESMCGIDEQAFHTLLRQASEEMGLACNGNGIPLKAVRAFVSTFINSHKQLVSEWCVEAPPTI